MSAAGWEPYYLHTYPAQYIITAAVVDDLFIDDLDCLDGLDDLDGLYDLYDLSEASMVQ